MFRLNTIIGGNPRFVGHCIEIGGVRNQYSWQSNAQAGGLWRYYYCTRQHLHEVNMSTNQKNHLPLPDDSWLDAGHIWTTEIRLLGATDTITEAVIKYHLYPVGV